MTATISKKSVIRLSIYRRELIQLQAMGAEYVFSHELATLTNSSSAQVRRDLMHIDAEGSSTKGYHINGLIQRLDSFLDGEEPTNVVLFGVGNLGKSLLQFYLNRRPNLKVVASFDTDESKAGRVICGVHCYQPEDAIEIIDTRDARLAIVAVPHDAVEGTAQLIKQTALRGVLNFAPAALHLPQRIEVMNMDITSKLEGLACMVR